MTYNAQIAVDELAALIPLLLDSYIEIPLVDFSKVMKEEGAKKVFKIISENCTCVQDIKDIYIWFGNLPAWWNITPFSNNKNNFFIFLHHYGEERKSAFLLYKMLIDLKNVHGKEKRETILKDFRNIP